MEYKEIVELDHVFEFQSYIFISGGKDVQNNIMRHNENFIKSLKTTVEILNNLMRTSYE